MPRCRSSRRRAAALHTHPLHCAHVRAPWTGLQCGQAGRGSLFGAPPPRTASTTQHIQKSYREANHAPRLFSAGWGRSKALGRFFLSLRLSLGGRRWASRGRTGATGAPLCVARAPPLVGRASAEARLLCVRAARCTARAALCSHGACPSRRAAGRTAFKHTVSTPNTARPFALALALP